MPRQDVLPTKILIFQCPHHYTRRFFCQFLGQQRHSQPVPDRLHQRLGINTLADYLDQTIWQAVFNVLAFLLCFIALYVLVCLVVNLLDHVISFPVVRGFDWLLGGLCGLGSYGIALWAMTLAPIALVAALRETSVIFGMLLAVIFLHERLSRSRILAILIVMGGAMLIRLG